MNLKGFIIFTLWINKYKLLIISILINIILTYTAIRIYHNNLILKDSVSKLSNQITSYNDYCKEQVLLQDKYYQSLSILKDTNESIVDKFNNINNIYNSRMFNK